VKVTKRQQQAAAMIVSGISSESMWRRGVAYLASVKKA